MHVAQQKRDEKGRLLAEDGWPVGGMATVPQVVAASELCRSMIYKLIDSGELESRRFGRAVRIPWSVVRQMFLDDSK